MKLLSLLFSRRARLSRPSSKFFLTSGSSRAQVCSRSQHFQRTRHLHLLLMLRPRFQLRLPLMSRIAMLPVLHFHLQRLRRQKLQLSIQLQLLPPELQHRPPSLLQPTCKMARAFASKACRLRLR
jgi:hypothetical protein